jgi:triosephosphate isomerase
LSSIICANWKMNLGPEGAKALIREILPAVQSAKKTRVWIAPPCVSITAAATTATGSGIKIGAQNAHWADAGPFTGEISVPMLQEVGAEFVIIGHSERRTMFGDTEEQVAKRANAVLSSRLFLVLCVGENLEQRKNGETQAVLEKQLRYALTGKTERELASTVIAYEPLWAIGSGNTASSEQISQSHDDIRKTLKEFSKMVRPPILYGGSVTSENFGEIIKLPGVDGALVGGASLDPANFIKMIEIAED